MNRHKDEELIAIDNAIRNEKLKNKSKEEILKDANDLIKRIQERLRLKKLKEEPKEEPKEEKKITKKDLKKSVKKLFKEESISEKRKDKLLEYIENKEYDKVIKALENKGVVFDQKY